MAGWWRWLITNRVSVSAPDSPDASDGNALDALLIIDTRTGGHSLCEVFTGPCSIVKTGAHWHTMPHDLQLTVVKLPEADGRKRSFIPLPNRWVVERDFA